MPTEERTAVIAYRPASGRESFERATIAAGVVLKVPGAVSPSAAAELFAREFKIKGGDWPRGTVYVEWMTRAGKRLTYAFTIDRVGTSRRMRGMTGGD